MMLTITFRYENGNFESEYKEFDNFDAGEIWAEKEKINRGANYYWIR